MDKGLIFDYGGTVDTGGSHWGKVFWHAYQHCGVPVTESLFREAYVSVERMLGGSLIIKPDFTFRQTLETKIRLQLECLGLHNSYGIVPFIYRQVEMTTAHSREVLLTLKQCYPMALVSNFYGNLDVVLREFSLDGVFQCVIDSAVVGVRKPDSGIFAIGVKALGLEASDVTVIGDSMKNDIIPAKALGCRTIWLKVEGWTDEDVDESIPDKVITDIAEIV